MIRVINKRQELIRKAKGKYCASVGGINSLHVDPDNLYPAGHLL